MINYQKLWRLLKERNISQYELIKTYRLSAYLIHQLKHCQTVRTTTIEKICSILDCKPIDIMTQEDDDELSRIVCYLREKEHKKDPYC